MSFPGIAIAVNQEMLLSYGYGDGGGGVNRDMLEMRRRLNEIPGIPHVETGRADAYFERLKKTFAEAKSYVHTWDGELYLELHRGTYTSQAESKRRNRKMELLLRETEWIAALAAVMIKDPSKYPKQDLDEAWKIVLRNQFHDIIPGTSIREVYEDSLKEYDQAKQFVDEAWDRAAQQLLKESANTDYVVFNSSTWNRDDLVTIPNAENMNGVWFDAAGNELTAQRSGGNWVVRVPDLPPMGFAAIHFKKDMASSSSEKRSPFLNIKLGVETTGTASSNHSICMEIRRLDHSAGYGALFTQPAARFSYKC
jgi:alpha-mannosidase